MAGLRGAGLWASGALCLQGGGTGLGGEDHGEGWQGGEGHGWG